MESICFGFFFFATNKKKTLQTRIHKVKKKNPEVCADRHHLFKN